MKRSLSVERSDVFGDAADHIAYWRAHGYSLEDLQAALGRPLRNWHDALIAVAQEQAVMILQNPALRRDRVTTVATPPLPFRKRA